MTVIRSQYVAGRPGVSRGARAASLAMRALVLVAATRAFVAPGRLLAQSNGAGAEVPVLSPGDSVLITVWRKPELSGNFVVSADSSIAHPLYRSVKVAGLPLPAAEARMRTFLEQYEASPQFVMQPLLRVAVGGEVRQPNLYSVPPGTSLEQAIALAGGPTERGKDRVRVVRREQAFTIDLRRPTASSARMAVRSGDQIIVERDRALFREVVTPVLTILGATAAIVNVLVNSNGNR